MIVRLKDGHFDKVSIDFDELPSSICIKMDGMQHHYIFESEEEDEAIYSYRG